MIISTKLLRLCGFFGIFLMISCGEKVTSKFVPSTEVVSSSSVSANQTVDPRTKNGPETVNHPKEESPSTDTSCSPSSAKKEFKVPIAFTEIEIGKSCAWGPSNTTPNSEENLSKKDAFFRAYLEQIQQVSLPNYKKICHLEVTHAPEKLRFDDEIFLLLQGKILASSKNYNQYFDKVGDVFAFQWPKLREMPYDSRANSKPYCIGSSTQCSIPLTETSGQFQLNLDQNAILNIIQQFTGNTTPPQLKFSLVTTGDNDDTDCRHSPINLELLIKYED